MSFFALGTYLFGCGGGGGAVVLSGAIGIEQAGLRKSFFFMSNHRPMLSFGQEELQHGNRLIYVDVLEILVQAYLHTAPAPLDLSSRYPS